MNKLAEEIYILVIDAGAAANLALDVDEIFIDLLGPLVRPDGGVVDPVDYDLIVNSRIVHLSLLSWGNWIPLSETSLLRLTDLIRKLRRVFDAFIVLTWTDAISSEFDSAQRIDGLESVPAPMAWVSLKADRVDVARELWAAISDEVTEVLKARRA